MTSSHRTDGPGGRVRPGPASLQAFFANDNAADPQPALIEGVAEALGLVLALETGENDTRVATIRIVWVDASFSEPLAAAHDGDDIIALWRSFGRDLGLPLYLRDAQGNMNAVSQLAGEFVYARRLGSPLSHRRPRIHWRRQVPLKPFASAARRKRGP